MASTRTPFSEAGFTAARALEGATPTGTTTTTQPRPKPKAKGKKAPRRQTREQELRALAAEARGLPSRGTSSKKASLREENLRALAGMPDVGTAETKFLGFIPTGGQHPTLSPSELATAETIARALGEHSPYTQHTETPMMLGKGDWKKIREVAAQRALYGAHAGTGPAGKAKKVTPIKAYEKEIASSPIARMETATAKMLTPAFNAASAYASGKETQSATQGAFTAALQSLSGASPVLGQTPAAWLSGNIKTAQTVDQPLTSAMAAYGGAEEAQLPSILAALKAYGQGNEIGIATAPENAWLNALISHVGTEISYYGTAPKAGVTGLPAAIAEALKAYGGPTGGTTSVALSSITTKGPYATVKGAVPGVPMGTTPALAGASVPGVTPGQAQGGATGIRP